MLHPVHLALNVSTHLPGDSFAADGEQGLEDMRRKTVLAQLLKPEGLESVRRAAYEEQICLLTTHLVYP